MPKQTIFTTCNERSPEPPFYGCCLCLGHKGDHKAWGPPESELLAQWAQALYDSEQAYHVTLTKKVYRAAIVEEIAEAAYRNGRAGYDTVAHELALTREQINKSGHALLTQRLQVVHELLTTLRTIINP